MLVMSKEIPFQQFQDHDQNAMSPISMVIMNNVWDAKYSY